MLGNLLEIIPEIGNPRTYYSRLTPEQSNIVSKFEDQRSSLTAEIVAGISAGNTSMINYVGMESFFVLWRYSNFSFAFIQDYDTSHLRNSLIRNVLLNRQYEIAHRVSIFLIIWYYYWFMKPMKNDQSLVGNVCYELEEAIKILIEKESTLYRGDNTADVIQALRWRLTAERTIEGAQRTLNFRT